MLFAHWCYFCAGAIALIFSGETSTPASQKLAKHIARQSKPVRGFVRRMSTKKLMTKVKQDRVQDETGNAPDSGSDVEFNEFVQHLKAPDVKEMHAEAEENL